MGPALTGRLPNTGDDVAVTEALLSGEAVQVTPREELVAPSLPNDEVRAAWRRLAATSTTIVPLRARGGTFGALALDNARLYGQQLKVAETLQRSLLTPPLQLADLQVAVRYRPAEAHQQVGGDWYDAFGQPDGGALLVIGDVVGHNVDAAAAMGQIRSILRGTAYDRPDDPAQVLTRVDEVLTGLHIGTMATALVARLDAPAAAAGSGSRVLCWSSAGHLPALVLTAEGTVETLHAAPDRLLGAGQSRRRTTHDAVLHPGDVLVFYTDGLVEHGRTGLDEGITRLTRTLAGLAGVDLETLCDQLLDRIVTGRADDDIAILAVRCCPPGSAPAR